MARAQTTARRSFIASSPSSRKRRWGVDAIVALLKRYPNGITQKYLGRIREEVQRSYDKFANSAAAAAGSPAGTGASSTIGPGPAAPPRVLRTIHIVASQLPRMLAETEEALLATGMPIFSRAGTLVHPVVETILAADGCKTTVARLRPFCADSLIEWIADAALFRRFDAKRNQWVDVGSATSDRYQFARARRPLGNSACQRNHHHADFTG